MNSPLNFALVGCGNIATEHATQIMRVGKLIAVADIDTNKAQQFGEQYGVPFFETAAAMYAIIKKNDVVVIATPNGLHASQAIEAMEAGYHVLVEKPVALTTADVDLLQVVSVKTGKQLFLVMQNRFNLPVKIIHELMQQQALGEIKKVQVNCFWHRPASYYANSWHGTMALDGGTLFTQFSHFIDLLCWLFGTVDTVQAQFNNTAHQGLIEFEDEGKVEILFHSGVHATMNYSVNEPIANKEGSITIYTTKGFIKASGAYLNELEFELADQALSAQLLDEQTTINNTRTTANDYGSYTGSMRNHRLVYDSLVAALLYQQPYYTSIAEAKNTIALIHQIYQTR